MNRFCAFFIARPVATTLLACALALVGCVACVFLPVASLPNVDLPIIRITASRPGADPATMSASVAAPLERALSAISGITELTSVSSLGNTFILAQFDRARNVDKAAQDVQGALNAAATDLPSDLPTLPAFRKANPNAAPVLILALTSHTLAPDAIYDAADTVLAQRLAQVEGVGEADVAGAEQPAVRVRINSARAAAMGLSLDAIRTALVNANAPAALGGFEGAARASMLAANQQLTTPQDYAGVVVRAANGTAVHVGDVADVYRGVRNTLAAGWLNTQPAVIITITKRADANVIATVDRVKAALPEFLKLLPAGIDVTIVSDRTLTIRAAIYEIERALMVAIGLVMLVVLVFLQRATPTIAAGLAVPLSLAGAFALMWLCGYALDNLSLMALTISVGFVVDDAIVVIENIHHNRERGLSASRAAIAAGGEIGFTIIAISLSLIAAFIPIIFMDGIVGSFFREFSMTLVFTIVFSTLVSLTVTPMVCAHLRPLAPLASGRKNPLLRGFDALAAFYQWSLRPIIAHPWAMLGVNLAVFGLTVYMFQSAPKGYFPQDDAGLIFGFTEASPDVSFAAMERNQMVASDLILQDPAVAMLTSNVGNGRTLNQGQIFAVLKPPAERGFLSSQQVINRLRPKLARQVPGISVFLTPAQDVRGGARQSKSAYQFTLWDANIAELEDFAPKVVAALQQNRKLVDVSTDRNTGGLQATLVIDRNAARRLGVAISDIDAALNDSFGQRQISTIYSQRNQYRVVLEVDPRRQTDPQDLATVYVISSTGAAVPLSAVASITRDTAPLVVNHQGPFPAITITYDGADGVSLEEATKTVSDAVNAMALPDTLHAEFAGDAKAFTQSAGGQGTLIFVALLAVYIILGVLYESLIHPLTIVSTLPSAGLGALIALRLFNVELTIIAFIGMIMLIGIVKKNGIMLVDYAIAAERRGLNAPEAIYEACLARFRPIWLTTLAALLGAVPLVIASGPGAELRRPLGITIVGGLILSQILTLYTTPVTYLLLGKLQRRKRLSALQKVGLKEGDRPCEPEVTQCTQRC